MHLIELVEHPLQWVQLFRTIELLYYWVSIHCSGCNSSVLLSSYVCTFNFEVMTVSDGNFSYFLCVNNA